MLYISREYAEGYFVVCDTDDGAEEVVTVEKLERMYYELGIEVAGVECGVYRGKKFFSANVYEKLVMITKLKTLKKLDIFVVNNILRYISFADCVGQLNLRLSDICGAVDNEAFKRVVSNPNASIVLILDDNLRLSERSATAIIQTRGFLKYDIRELSDDKAELIYNAILELEVGLVKSLGFPVIDNEERYLRYIAEQTLCLSMTAGVIPVPEMCFIYREYIASKYKERLCDNKRVRWTDEPFMLYKQYPKERFDVKQIYDKNFIRLFCSMLLACTSINTNISMRLANYMYYWGDDKDIRERWRKVVMSAYK